jgi:hypothetical protein
MRGKAHTDCGASQAHERRIFVKANRMRSLRTPSNPENLSGTGQPTAGRAWKASAGPILIVIAAATATAPLWFRGTSCGHDFDFHLVSWFDCLSAWRHGILYPHWSPSPNFGAGEPRFVFYPPLTWMLGAALGLVLPWPLVGIALTFLLLAGTGLATRALARKFLGDAAATLAGCAALFSGYALFTAYERSAFGELAGGFWIPLLLLYLFRARKGSPRFLTEFRVSVLPLALILAGAWLSNAPLGVMASYLLAAAAVALAVIERSWAHLVRAALAAALGIGVAAFYLVPAAWEQKWVDIRQATDDPGLKIENSFLFGHAADPSLELHNEELRRVSMIAVAMVGVALGGVLVAWRRKALPLADRRWLVLALIPLVVLLMQLPVSLFFWNLLPKLRFLQFPWRWLVVVEAPMGIFFAAVIWPAVSVRRWPRIAIATASAAIFLLLTASADRFFFQPCDDEDAVVPMLQEFRNGAGFQGTDEYAPNGADDYVVATGLPDACLVSNPKTTLGIVDTAGANPDWWIEQHSCEAVFKRTTGASQAGPEHLQFDGTMPHAGTLILRLRKYPAWHIRVNGQPASESTPRDDGLIDLAVPEGPVEVTVDWTTTPDVWVGRWLSIVALLVLTAVCLPRWVGSKLRRSHLS